MRWRDGSLRLLVALLAVAARLGADVIMLENGSRLVGTISGILPGKVLLTTDFAGTLALDASRVVHLRADKPLHVAFEDGQRVKGTLAAAEVGAVLETAPGVLPVAGLKPVRAAWAEGQPEPAPPTAPGRVWAHELALDLGGRSGNSQKFRVGGALKSVLTGPRDRTMLYARGTKAEENHQETENETLGGVDFERTFRDRHLWYARGEIEQDDIEGLDLRTTTAGGYGYYFVKEPTQSLRGRVGLQYRHERYDTGLTEDTLAPEFGLRYEAALRTWAKLVSEVTYAPAFDRPSDYRLDHTTAVDIPLAAAKRWALRLGVTNSYNSIAVEDHDKLETLYLARLVLKLP